MSAENQVPMTPQTDPQIPQAPVQDPAQPLAPVAAEPEGKKGKKKKKKEDPYTNPNNRKFRVLGIVCAAIGAFVIFLLVAFCFMGNTWFVHLDLDDLGEDSAYTEDQIKEAAAAVKSNFSKELNGSVLMELEYDPERSAEQNMICFDTKFYSMFGDGEKVDETTYVKRHYTYDVSVSGDDYNVENHGYIYKYDGKNVAFGADETQPPTNVE